MKILQRNRRLYIRLCMYIHDICTIVRLYRKISGRGIKKGDYPNVVVACACGGIVAEGPRVLFRVNYPVIINTLKHSIKYLLNVNKRINMNGKEIQELYERSEKDKLENHSVEEYYNQFDKEYEEFVKEMEA